MILIVSWFYVLSYFLVGWLIGSIPNLDLFLTKQDRYSEFLEDAIYLLPPLIPTGILFAWTIKKHLTKRSSEPAGAGRSA